MRRSECTAERRRRAGVPVGVLALAVVALFVSGGLTQARPVRVEEGHPVWWMEITQAWDRFYALRSYRARVSPLSAGAEELDIMWEVVRRGPRADLDELRMVWSSRDGKYRQETVKTASEVWQVTWRPRIRNPEQARMEEEAMRRLASRAGAAAMVRTTGSHHILCMRAVLPVVITAPDPEIRRLMILGHTQLRQAHR